MTRARFILHSVSGSGDYDDYSVPPGVAAPVSGSGVGFGVTPGAAVTSLRSPAAYIPVGTPDRCHPRQHGFPTGCLAGPVPGERQRGQRGRDVRPRCGTLCASLHTRQERRDQSIAALPRSSSASCRDCRVTVAWEFVIWSATQGMGQLGEGTEGGARRRFMARYRSEERRERFLSRQDVATWGVGLRTRRVGAGVLVYVTVSRDSGTG